MNKQTDETLFFLLHVEDAPPVAPDCERQPQTPDRPDVQLRRGIDFESSLSIGASVSEKSAGLGQFLLGSLIAFAAISLLSAVESVQNAFHNARRRLAVLRWW